MSRILALALALTLVACTTRQSRSVKTSGFLGDYSQLREGEGSEALLVYFNPATDFTKYDKVLIDSVTMWASEDLDLQKLSKEEQKALTDYLYAALRRELAKHFAIVVSKGPGVMEIRAAITEAEDANVTLDVVTTVVPQLRLLTTLGGLATDVAAIVGEASAELEVRDAVSGERLAAAVDKRVGTKSLGGVFSDWADVQAAFDDWAERAGTRLHDLHQGKKTEE
jgi:hypothetical protein